MAENHNAVDVEAKKSIYKSNLFVPIIGQIFTFLLGAGSLCACVYLASKGLAGGAITAMIAGFSPIVINALKNFRQNGQSKYHK
jgi:hypothetical protein